jgi:hypothetical protein
LSTALKNGGPEYAPFLKFEMEIRAKLDPEALALRQTVAVRECIAMVAQWLVSVVSAVSGFSPSHFHP